MQDTFYVNNSNGEDNVLRTHTSPVQVRTMLNSKPPIKLLYQEEPIEVTQIQHTHQCSIRLKDWL